MNANHLPLFEDVDVIQVGARSMQNFELLKKLGRSNKPILIKRGLANAIKELLMSDEYVISGGNENIILCERGCAPLRRLPGTPWTCPPSLSSTNCPTCPSLWPQPRHRRGPVRQDYGHGRRRVPARGSCVQPPTSLLSIVASSVRGKTAVDLHEGKNWWAPSPSPV